MLDVGDRIIRRAGLRPKRGELKDGLRVVRCQPERGLELVVCGFERRVEHWTGLGAQLSPTAKRLVQKFAKKAA